MHSGKAPNDPVRLERPGMSVPPARATLAAGIVLALLAALPFAFAVRPQQADYPSHLARYYIMLDGGQSPWLAKYYSFDWAFRGNLGVDLLMVPMGRLLGVENAAWLIAMLLPVLVALGIFAVEWTLRRRIGVGALLALATVWSPSMGMGLANFNLSLALALFAFALWVRLAAWPRRAWLFVPLGCMIWICHSAGWGVLGVMVFGYEWHRQRSWRALIAPWPLFLPFLFTMLEAGASGTLPYGADPVHFKVKMWLKAFSDADPLLDLISLAVLAGAIALAIYHRRIDGRLGWAALIVALLSLAIPRHLGGGDLADARLVAVALMLGCQAIDVPGARWLLWLAPVLFLGRLAVTCGDWHEQSAILENALPALELVPEGASIAAAHPHVVYTWRSAPLAHAGSYATLYRDALVNSHFAIPGVHMLRVRGMGRNFVDPSQRVPVRRGRPVNLEHFAPARHADYLWYVGQNPVGKLPAGARVLYRARGSLLAQLAKPESER